MMKGYAACENEPEGPKSVTKPGTLTRSPSAAPMPAAPAPPAFTHNAAMLELGDSAEAAASRFLAGPFESGISAEWVQQPQGASGSPAGVDVFRKPGAEFYEGYVPPFR